MEFLKNRFKDKKDIVSLIRKAIFTNDVINRFPVMYRMDLEKQLKDTKKITALLYIIAREKQDYTVKELIDVVRNVVKDKKYAGYIKEAYDNTIF